jgi:hypothetical protein
MYKKTDGKFYTLDSTGLETEIGKGGSSGRNYLQDYFDATKAPGTLSLLASATANLVSISANYADTASGAAALTSSAVSPLRQTTSYLTAYTGASVAGATFVQFQAQTLDAQDLGKPVSISFDYFTTVTDFDVVVMRYNSTGVFQETMQVFGNTVSTASATPSSLVPLGRDTFNGYIIAGNTATDIYALRFRRVTGTSQLKIDSLFVGPSPLGTSTAITDWQLFTASTANISGIIQNIAYYRRVGQNIQIVGRVGFSAQPTGTITLGIPSGIVPENGALPTPAGSDVTCLGGATLYPNSGSATYHGDTYLASATTIAFNGSATPIWNGTNPVALTSGAAIGYNISFPVVGWSSNTFSANNALTEYASNTDVSNGDTIASGFYNGVDGAAFGAYNTANRIKYVRFATAISPTDDLYLEVTENAGKWVKQEQTFAVMGGVNTGMKWARIAGTDTDCSITFGSVGYTANLASGGASTWSSVSGSPTQYRWRLVKRAAGGNALYPIGARNILGDTTGTPVPAALIGEEITSDGVTTTVVTNNSWQAQVGITLTPGQWIVSGGIQAVNNGATGFVRLAGAISTLTTVPDNQRTGIVDDRFVNTTNMTPAASMFRRIRVPAGTTLPLYVIGLTSVSTGSPQYTNVSYMTATRIA